MVTDLSQLCPPLFSLGLLRIDSPSSHSKEAYANDRQFFALHKKDKRVLYLRAAYAGEFDMLMSLEDMLRTPRLHVLVAQLATGIHQITPVYRGTDFYYAHDSDSEVIQIVIEMARREGINKVEFEAFSRENNQRIRASQSVASVGAIN